MRSGESFGRRAAGAAGLVLAAVVLGAPALSWGQEKQVPPRILPRKEIPNEARYRQAPALDPRQEKNREAVNQARGQKREMKPGGTAFGPQPR